MQIARVSGINSTNLQQKNKIQLKQSNPIASNNQVTTGNQVAFTGLSSSLIDGIRKLFARNAIRTTEAAIEHLAGKEKGGVCVRFDRRTFEYFESVSEALNHPQSEKMSELVHCIRQGVHFPQDIRLRFLGSPKLTKQTIIAGDTIHSVSIPPDNHSRFLAERAMENKALRAMYTDSDKHGNEFYLDLGKCNFHLSEILTEASRLDPNIGYTRETRVVK